MALTAGSRLGSYEILAPLGAGGMGEVYRARDTKLGREVAIKILPAAVASDGDRLGRLEREARVLASLNHPNIATLYGLEDAGGVTALVMELVEGETLARRMGDVAIGDPRSIADHPIVRSSIRLAEALVIARQIADAFDAAHERGIVHRDLKPANIVIAANGTVKVLDFGLAKETATAAGADALTHSPTMIAPTVDGLLLGTAPYMSPEQARGQAVDKRTDIWAFGCVLYEMLTGHRAFGGETTTDTLAAIIEREPDWAALPSSTSPAIRRLLRKCLQKDVRRRLHDIADARIDIDETIVGAAGDVDSGAATTAPTARARATSALLAVVALAAAAIVGWTAGRRDRSSAAPPSAVDVSLVPLTTDPGYEGEPTFAPDGETVAYVSDRTGNLEIFLKQASGGRDINLTDDPADDIQPAFSPDGRQIAFVSSRSGASSILPYGTDNPLMGGDIWVMPALGGSARRIAQKGNFPSWSPDGSRILYISGPWSERSCSQSLRWAVRPKKFRSNCRQRTS